MGEQPWAPDNPYPPQRTPEPSPPLSRFAHLGTPGHSATPSLDTKSTSSAPYTPSAPHTPAPERRLPFWRRITQAKPPQPEARISAEALLERLHWLETRLAADRAHDDERLARTEQALREIEERQKQVSLAELHEKLAGLEVDQTEAEEAFLEATRKLKWMGALLGVSMAMGAGALLLLLR